MESLIDRLHGLVEGPLGMVLHVGADADDLATYARLGAARLVLVQADTSRAAELRRSAARQAVPARVLEAVVAPAAGPLSWHRYNVRALDGVADVSPLRAYYPRLRRLGTKTVDAIAFGGLVDEAADDDGPQGPNLLVLDAPGQDRSLLDSLTDGQRERFDWILVRSCSAGTEPAPPVGGSEWVDLELPAAADPLWPVSLRRFDRQARSMRLQREQAERNEAELASLRDRSTALQDELDRAARDAQDRAAEVEALRAELQGSRSERDEALARAALGEEQQAQLQSQVDALGHERDQAARDAQDRAAEAEALRAELQGCRSERDEALARAARVDGLQAQLQRQQAEQEALTGQHAEQARRSAQLVADAQRNAALSAKLQLLRDNDLRELQSRYEALQDQCRNQQDLLTKLAQRLTTATRYFQRLALEQRSDELVEGETADEPR